MRSTEVGEPPGAVLGGAGRQVEDLPVPVGVDPDGQQGVDVDGAPVFTDLDHQGVGGEERVGPGVQRTRPELGDVGSEVHELLHPPGGDPSR